jgi:hypothetical protein
VATSFPAAIGGDIFFQHGDGSDGDSGEDGRMGLEADSRAFSEVEGGVYGTGEAVSSAVAIGVAKSKSRGTCSAAGKREKNQKRARSRRAALEQRALTAANEDATWLKGLSL